MPEKRLCWRCKGRRMVYGWKNPGDPKQSWFNCPLCQGKGWLPGTEDDGR
jgi:hypothetical protein